VFASSKWTTDEVEGKDEGGAAKHVPFLRTKPNEDEGNKRPNTRKVKKENNQALQKPKFAVRSDYRYDPVSV